MGSPNAQRITLPPIYISGTDVDVDLTGGGRLTAPPALVKVGNMSPYLLVLNIGTHQDYLRPWETNVYPCYQSTLHVHPLVLRNTPVLPVNYGSNPLGGTLACAVATHGTDFPGTYPIMNTGLVSTFSQPQVMGQIEESGAHTGATFPVPAGAQSVGYSARLISPYVLPTTVSMVGVQTGMVYANVALNAVPLYNVPLSPQDTEIACQVFAPAGQESLVSFVAFPDNNGYMVPSPYTAMGTFAGAPAGVNYSLQPYHVYAEGYGSFELLAADPAKTIKVWEWGLDMADVVGSRLLCLYDTSIGQPSGRICVIDGPTGSHANGDKAGTPLMPGAGLNIGSTTLSGEMVRAWATVLQT